MAHGILHHHHHYHHYHFRCIFPIQSNHTFTDSYSFSTPPTFPPLKRFPNVKNPSRFRTVPKSSSSSSNRNSSGTIPDNSKTSSVSDDDDRVNIPDHDPDPNPVSLFWIRFRKELSLDGLGMQVMSIALPAALALAADPITSLVDTAFVGHLGSAELAAVGVSGAVFNLVSKLFNVPLLNITTSFVAEEQVLAATAADDDCRTAQDGSKICLPSVSTSLMLAAGLGILEAVALSAGSSILLNTLGIPVDSPMRLPAEQFLTLRAFGAPPIVIALAAQGAFRGFKDTKTPLFAVGAGNLLNAILDPILIFSLGFGISGAAIATVISEYLAAFILLWKLSGEMQIIAPIVSGQRIVKYVKSGALLTGRTLAVLATTTIATAMAAKEGPVHMAGHQICFQVWLALSLLNDALAIAGQTLLASEYSQGNYGPAREVTYRVLQIGMAMGIALAVILFIEFDALSSLFTTDSEVLEVAKTGTLFVAGSQPMNAVAFVLDGLYYGVSDFGFAAYSMVLVGVISSVFLLVSAPAFGLRGVWWGLFLFMTLRVVAGVFRLSTRSGPWRLLLPDSEMDNS